MNGKSHDWIEIIGKRKKTIQKNERRQTRLSAVIDSILNFYLQYYLLPSKCSGKKW